MKKLLIPIVALLAFSMLSTSVSAGIPYYMAGFYAEASGPCHVYEGGPPVTGKGSVHVRGSAIVRREPAYQGYWARRLPPSPNDPNTRIWTRRTRLTASWNNTKLTAWLRPAYTVFGLFNDTLNRFWVNNMTYFSYYMGEAGLQFTSGRAHVFCEIHPMPYLRVDLYRGTVPWVTFYWFGAEHLDWPVARHVARRVTVWGPIPWQPSGP